MDRWDLIVAVGLASLFMGLWMLAPWAAPTTVGGLLVVLGVAGARGDDTPNRR